jgi:hypothetical protein
MRGEEAMSKMGEAILRLKGGAMSMDRRAALRSLVGGAASRVAPTAVVTTVAKAVEKAALPDGLTTNRLLESVVKCVLGQSHGEYASLKMESFRYVGDGLWRVAQMVDWGLGNGENKEVSYLTSEMLIVGEHLSCNNRWRMLLKDERYKRYAVDEMWNSLSGSRISSICYDRWGNEDDLFSLFVDGLKAGGHEDRAEKLQDMRKIMDRMDSLVDAACCGCSSDEDIIVASKLSEELEKVKLALDEPLEACCEGLRSGMAKLEKDNGALVEKVLRMPAESRMKNEEERKRYEALKKAEEEDRKVAGKNKKTAGAGKKDGQRLAVLLKIKDTVLGALGEALTDKAAMTVAGPCSHVAAETCLRVVRRIDEQIATM